ncbi:MAG: hypothetical protein WC729_29485 [Sphingomonas sp.]|uniref:hypothetical protein n=1 Tax=Sphingomonas sp. TaxID=28214 RepID=UPI003569402B
MKMLSLDPGIRGCGVALWEGKQLVRCEYVKGASAAGSVLAAAHAMAQQVRAWAPDDVTFLALEWPQVYRVGKGKGDNNDLLALAAVLGALVALFPLAGFEVFKPAEWKGQVPKDIMGNRIVGKLEGREVVVFRAAKVIKSLEHNVIDGVGIGLKALGRL